MGNVGFVAVGKLRSMTEVPARAPHSVPKRWPCAPLQRPARCYSIRGTSGINRALQACGRSAHQYHFSKERLLHGHHAEQRPVAGRSPVFVIVEFFRKRCCTWRECFKAFLKRTLVHTRSEFNHRRHKGHANATKDIWSQAGPKKG